ncbi:MAG: hypothetical protein SVW02_02470 [Candidatus Nanohaloarchaea archaeon]|nr:hypothetical protein [Candidatus Nanohaloarchaea archaeon]
MEVQEKWREANREAADTLNDPEQAFSWIKRLSGLAIGLSVSSVSFAFAVTYVQQGSTVLVFAALALFWSGYLFAHYTATGKLIHQGGSGEKLPGTRFRDALAVIGILLILSGITVMPYPVVEGDLVKMSLAGLTAGVGYVIAHYGFTGDLM